MWPSNVKTTTTTTTKTYCQNTHAHAPAYTHATSFTRIDKQL